jgi:hypothetical protein
VNQGLSDITRRVVGCEPLVHGSFSKSNLRFIV